MRGRHDRGRLPPGAEDRQSDLPHPQRAGCARVLDLRGRTEAGSTVHNLLDEHGIDSVDIVGIATDYCVRASALDALAQGQHVRVLTDLVAGVAQASSEAALAELVHAGAELAVSAQDA
ncbi:isochorismatase family protein [Leifsonia poae]|uniref:isochorismatase family protein n=1 Tax=Leifsonia poae TaxID=110933 RepID=UPI0035A97ABD